MRPCLQHPGMNKSDRNSSVTNRLLVAAAKAKERLLLVKPGSKDGHQPGRVKCRASSRRPAIDGVGRDLLPIAAREKRTAWPTAAALTTQGRALAELSLLGYIPLFWNAHHPYLGTVHAETARVPRCPAAAGLAPLLARLRSGPHRETQSQATLGSPSGPELTPAIRDSLSCKSQALCLAETLPSAQRKQGH